MAASALKHGLRRVLSRRDLGTKEDEGVTGSLSTPPSPLETHRTATVSPHSSDPAQSGNRRSRSLSNRTGKKPFGQNVEGPTVLKHGAKQPDVAAFPSVRAETLPARRLVTEPTDDRTGDERAYGLSTPANGRTSDTTDSWTQPNTLPAQKNQEKRRSLTHKPNIFRLRDAVEIGQFVNPTQPVRTPTSTSSRQRRPSSIKRSNLEKPLPPSPLDHRGPSPVPDTKTANGKKGHFLVEDSKYPVDLTGIVDLTHTEDTTVHERWAPAVTHETIIQPVHEIREEHITREIHNHHVHHRILPIVDIQVLPARHFVPAEGGGLVEISEDEIPDRTGPDINWIIAEATSKLLPKSEGPVAPRQFSARDLEPEMSDYKETVTPHGFKRTETWWVHPPTLETGGRDTGQTCPFHLGSDDPADDGFRAEGPLGQVKDSSSAINEDHRQLGRESWRREASRLDIRDLPQVNEFQVLPLRIRRPVETAGGGRQET